MYSANIFYLIISLDCIITGPGAEYGGTRSFGTSKRKCKSWNRKYKLGNAKVRKKGASFMAHNGRQSENVCQTVIKINSLFFHYLLITFQSIKFHNKHFSDGSRAKARNFCRNPDDDTGGPWCYVEEKSYELVEKEYCDIPSCDDKGLYYLI